MLHRAWVLVLPFIVVIAVACTDEAAVSPSSEAPTSAAASGLEVPDLSGLTTTEADQELQGMGLLLEVMTATGGDDHTILAQSPAAGTAAEVGSIVTVTARCSPAPCPFPGESREIYDPCTCASR
jgi:hypothetical protein